MTDKEPSTDAQLALLLAKAQVQAAKLNAAVRRVDEVAGPYSSDAELHDCLSDKVGDLGEDMIQRRAELRWTHSLLEQVAAAANNSGQPPAHLVDVLNRCTEAIERANEAIKLVLWPLDAIGPAGG